VNQKACIDGGLPHACGFREAFSLSLLSPARGDGVATMDTQALVLALVD